MVNALAVKLGELNRLAYGAFLELSSRIEERTLRDGSARWLLAPVLLTVRATDSTVPDAPAVAVTFHMDSQDSAADLSWMATKAYIYALYTGCIDQLRRETVNDGRHRILRGDHRVAAEAMVGNILMYVTITITPAFGEEF